MWSWKSVCSQLNVPLGLNTLFLSFCFLNHVWPFNDFLLNREKSMKNVSLHPYLPLPVLYKHEPLLTNGGNQIQTGLWMLTSLSVFFPPPFPHLSSFSNTGAAQYPGKSSHVSFPSPHHILAPHSSLPASVSCVPRHAFSPSLVLEWHDQFTSVLHFGFSHPLSHLDFYLPLSCLLHSPFLPNSVLLSLLIHPLLATSVLNRTSCSIPVRTALSQIAIRLNSVKPCSPDYSYNTEAESLLLIWRIQNSCVGDSCCSWTITEADQSHWSDVIVLCPMLLLLNIRIMLLRMIWFVYHMKHSIMNILHTSCYFSFSVFCRRLAPYTNKTNIEINKNNTNNNQHKHNATKKNIKQLYHSKMAQTKTTSMWGLSVRCRDLALDKQWQPSFLFTFCCLFGLAAICPLWCSQCYCTFRNVTLLVSNLKRVKTQRKNQAVREKKVCFTVYLTCLCFVASDNQNTSIYPSELRCPIKLLHALYRHTTGNLGFVSRNAVFANEFLSASTWLILKRLSSDCPIQNSLHIFQIKSLLGLCSLKHVSRECSLLKLTTEWQHFCKKKKKKMLKATLLCWKLHQCYWNVHYTKCIR